jgi:hypothetical protein
MTKEASAEAESDIRYACTTGHAIPAAALNELSEIVSLDAGAQVRVCREHGAPVRTSLPPGANAKD